MRLIYRWMYWCTVYYRHGLRLHSVVTKTACASCGTHPSNTLCKSLQHVQGWPEQINTDHNHGGLHMFTPHTRAYELYPIPDVDPIAACSWVNWLANDLSGQAWSVVFRGISQVCKKRSALCRCFPKTGINWLDFLGSKMSRSSSKPWLIVRSILDGYFNPLFFWYQWEYSEYLLTSKEFIFCRVSKIGNDRWLFKTTVFFV